MTTTLLLVLLVIALGVAYIIGYCHGESHHALNVLNATKPEPICGRCLRDLNYCDCRMTERNLTDVEMNEIERNRNAHEDTDRGSSDLCRTRRA